MEQKPGRREEVQRLFLRHSAAIRGFIFTLVPDNDDADDLLQDVFITATEKADAFEPGTNFLAWIYTIARYKILSLHRRQSKLKLLSPAAIEALTDDAPANDLLDLKVGTLRACLEKLAPAARQMIEMRYRESRSPREIASMRQSSPFGVNVALSRARAFLRRCMDSKLEQEAARVQ